MRIKFQCDICDLADYIQNGKHHDFSLSIRLSYLFGKSCMTKFAVFFKDLIYLISKTISICKRKFFKSSRHAYESMNWFCRSSIISSWYYELNDIIHIRCIYTCHIIYLKYILFGVVTFRYTHPYYYHKYLKYNSCYIF